VRAQSSAQAAFRPSLGNLTSSPSISRTDSGAKTGCTSPHFAHEKLVWSPRAEIRNTSLPQPSHFIAPPFRS